MGGGGAVWATRVLIRNICSSHIIDCVIWKAYIELSNIYKNRKYAFTKRNIVNTSQIR